MLYLLASSRDFLFVPGSMPLVMITEIPDVFAASTTWTLSLSKRGWSRWQWQSIIKGLSLSKNPENLCAARWALSLYCLHPILHGRLLTVLDINLLLAFHTSPLHHFFTSVLGFTVNYLWLVYKLFGNQDKS